MTVTTVCAGVTCLRLKWHADQVLVHSIRGVTCRGCCESQAGKLLDEGCSSVGWHHAGGQEDVCQLQEAGPVLGSEDWRLQAHHVELDGHCSSQIE